MPRRSFQLVLIAIALTSALAAPASAETPSTVDPTAGHAARAGKARPARAQAERKFTYVASSRRPSLRASGRAAGTIFWNTDNNKFRSDGTLTDRGPGRSTLSFKIETTKEPILITILPLEADDQVRTADWEATAKDQPKRILVTFCKIYDNDNPEDRVCSTKVIVLAK